jgi:transcription initiation factor TFIIA large subunit
LTKLNVAHCPWDPPPPQPQIANPPTLPSNVKAEASTAPSTLPSSSGGVHIKQEVKYENGAPNYASVNGYSGGGINPMAHQRAQQLLAQQYGQQATASIQAGGMPQQPRPLPHPGQQQRPTHIQLPGQPQQRPQQPYHPQHNNLSAAQTDGAGDYQQEWITHVAVKQAQGADGRLAADFALYNQLTPSMDAATGGLFAPLSSLPRKSRKVAVKPATPSSSRAIGQFDGVDDEDDKAQIKRQLIEEDEDAINSDLDDDDDLGEQPDDDDGDGPVGETILCTYDKVQRVKNKVCVVVFIIIGKVKLLMPPPQKWKCTLKDGILTTGNREYVFHKANGEFEW